jgi:hypothetical protein
LTTDFFGFGFGYDSSPDIVARAKPLGDTVRAIVPNRVAYRDWSRTASPGLPITLPVYLCRQ